LGDAFGAGIVYHLSRDDLAQEDEDHRLAALTEVEVDAGDSNVNEKNREIDSNF